MQSYLRSSQLAKIAGVSVKTLRHYLDKGLLTEPHRDANGYRQDPPSALVRLIKIKYLQTLGFSLQEICRLLEQSTESETFSSALEQLHQQVQQNLQQLQNQLRQIEHLMQNPQSVEPLPLEEMDFSSMADEWRQHFPDISDEVWQKMMAFDRKLLALSENLNWDDQSKQNTRNAFALLQQHPQLATQITPIVVAFFSLENESEQAEIDAVVEKILAFEKTLVSTGKSSTSRSDSFFVNTFHQLIEEELNPSQKRVMNLLEQSIR